MSPPIGRPTRDVDNRHRARLPLGDGLEANWDVADCIRNALADASMTFDHIDYITLTEPVRQRTTRWNISGPPLCLAIMLPSVSSNKSMIGHTLSRVKAVFTLLTLEHQRIPPTINYDVPDPAIPFDVVPNKARRPRHRVLSASAARMSRSS